MRFEPWLKKNSNDETIKYCAYFVESRIDFPCRSSLSSIRLYCERTVLPSEIYEKFVYAWNQFLKSKNPTISQKYLNRMKIVN